MAKAMVVADQQSAGLEKAKGQFERLRSFLGDVRSEMKKVNTPSKEEVRSTTTVVLLTVFFFAFFFWMVDFILNHSINALITKLSTH